jgi:hypothetical protein
VNPSHGLNPSQERNQIESPPEGCGGALALVRACVRARARVRACHTQARGVGGWVGGWVGGLLCARARVGGWVDKACACGGGRGQCCECREACTAPISAKMVGRAIVRAE